jgi:hypothetical protein
MGVLEIPDRRISSTASPRHHSPYSTEFLPFRTITVLLPPIIEVSAHQHTQVMSSHPAQCPTWSAISCVFWSTLGLQKQSLLGMQSLAGMFF